MRFVNAGPRHFVLNTGLRSDWPLNREGAMALVWDASLPPFAYAGAFTTWLAGQPYQMFFFKLDLSPGSYQISVLPDLIVLTSATAGITPDDLNVFAAEVATTPSISLEAEKTVLDSNGYTEVYTDDYYLMLGGTNMSLPIGLDPERKRRTIANAKGFMALAKKRAAAAGTRGAEPP